MLEDIHEETVNREGTLNQEVNQITIIANRKKLKIY